jgi:hypothetical protein
MRLPPSPPANPSARQDVAEQLARSPEHVPFGLTAPHECLRRKLDFVKAPACRRCATQRPVLVTCLLLRLSLYRKALGYVRAAERKHRNARLHTHPYTRLRLTHVRNGPATRPYGRPPVRSYRHMYGSLVASYRDSRLDAPLMRGCHAEVALFCTAHPARALDCLRVSGTAVAPAKLTVDGEDDASPVCELHTRAPGCLRLWWPPA